MNTQEKTKEEKDKKMDNNEIKLGDVVVWNFVFDVAEEKGVVVGLDGDRVQVQYDGYNGKVHQDWLSIDEILLESVYDSQVF